MAKVPVYADGKGSYKVQDYWDRIESEGLITDQEVDKIDNGDGTYEVTTTPGYVFEITVEPNEEIADNIIIGECIGKGENLNIGLRVVNKTTNSIEVEVVRAEGASNFKYSIKKQGEEYGEAVESESTTYKFEGLTQGGIYTIKVEATKDGEQQTVERTVQVGEIPRAIDGKVTWTGNEQAQVRIYTNETGYQLEWQKNGISEGSWTRENAGVKEKTITGLVNGDTIYARLYDGVSSGKYANIEVLDNTPPEITRFEATEITWNSVAVECVASDTKSGLTSTNTYKFYLNDETESKGTSTDGIYTYENLKGLTNYKLRVEVYDNAGNKEESSINVTTKEATIEDTLDISDNQKVYVEIPNKKGGTILCNVLYNDEINGLQIISVNSVDTVTLSGKDTYNDVINILNKKAEEYNYFGNDYVEARCVGCRPVKDENLEYESGAGEKNNWGYTMKNQDDKYLADYNKMGELGIKGSNTEYWLASRNIYINSNYKYFVVRTISASGILGRGGDHGGYELASFASSSGNGPYTYTNSCGFRPVFTLKSGIKITGGNGTEELPYTLGI